jgi:predicted ester cyclase
MNSIQIVKDSFGAMEKGDFEKLEKNLDKDYQLVGPAPKPVGKKEAMQMFKALKTAFPDWAFNITELKEAGDRITCLLHITGTHSGTLDLSFLGIPSQTATGTKVRQPTEPAAVELRGGKVYRLEVGQVEGGGLEGLFKQIGASVTT